MKTRLLIIIGITIFGHSLMQESFATHSDEFNHPTPFAGITSEVEPDCPPHTKLTDGVCVVIPVERNLFMHGLLGPFLLILLVGMMVTPFYAIRKFKTSVNKILFIISISVAAILFSHVMFGEFFLIDDRSVAPSPNESFFFSLSIWGSFFVIFSFIILGIVYWRKNEHPNKMMILTFFIIALTPLVALLLGILPRGANV